MGQAGDVDRIEIVTRRIDFLETLSESPHRKPELVDTLSHSRSTVDRAIRTLSDAGLVTRTDDGYVTTTSGQFAAERYRAFLGDERDILDAQDALAPVPSSCDLPVELLSSAAVDVGDGTCWLFEHVGALLRSADHYRAALPRLADSRHVRLCQARVDRGALTATIALTSDVVDRCREEFPELAVALAETDGLAVEQIPEQPFGLVLVGRDAGPTTAAVITYDENGVAGLIRNDTATAVEWVREQFDALDAEAHDATDALSDVEMPGNVTTLPAGDARLSPTLRSQGFVRVDAAFLDRREPLDRETGWRGGLGLSDVAAGDAVEGEREDENGQISAFEDIERRLRDGTDVALLGPPDAGKSTVCKQVAVRWHETGAGAVLYRASESQSFDAIGALESAIESDPGHTLVVVEDAVRSEANTVFEVMQAVSGRSDVSFLLDSRESEWHDPDTLPIDARLEAFRQEVVETVAMQPVETTTSRSVD